MGYTPQQFREAVERFGEVYFVLDSDREYIVHGTDGYEIDGDNVPGKRETVEVKGMKDDELVIAVFPLDSIEHHYTHKEI